MMKKILMTLFVLIAFIGSANTDSLTDTDKAAQKALAEQYVQALKDKDLNAVNQLIDYEVYADNMLTKLSVKSQQPKKSLLKRKEQFIQGQQRLQQIYSNYNYFAVIGWRELPDFSGYVVRLINGGIPVYLGIVSKEINQQWKIVDFYDPTKQDVMSNFIATSMHQIYFGKDSLIAGLSKSYSDVDMDNLLLFHKKIKQNKYPQAEKLYRNFSDDLKKEEAVLNTGLAISPYYPNSQNFDNELLAVIAQYHKNNPKYYGQLVKYFVIKKDYDKAREILQNFFTLLSDNAILNFKLVSISVAEKDYPRALQESKQCIKADPYFLPCYNTWARVADTMRNYDEEVLAYQTGSIILSIELNKSMFNAQEHSDFIHSDAFKNWDIPEN